MFCVMVQYHSCNHGIYRGNEPSPIDMTTLAGFIIPSTLTGVLILAVALIILWVIVSFPVYIAGKLITDGKGEYGDAMVATLGGGIVYIIILFGGTFLLTYIIAPDLALAISFILALVAWVAVYSDSSSPLSIFTWATGHDDIGRTADGEVSAERVADEE